jgi:hypothetical protein
MRDTTTTFADGTAVGVVIATTPSTEADASLRLQERENLCQETRMMEMQPVERLHPNFSAIKARTKADRMTPAFRLPGCVAQPMFATVLTALQEHGFAGDGKAMPTSRAFNVAWARI